MKEQNLFDAPIRPLPVIQYPGSKVMIAKLICQEFPPHYNRVDLFGGSATITLASPRPKYQEVFNDIDENLVNLFSVLQDKDSAREFIRLVKWSTYSDHTFEKCKIKSEDDSHIMRAFKYYAINKMTRNNSVSFRSNGTTGKDKGGNNIAQRMQNLEPLRRCHQRFQGVIIRNLDFREVFRIYGNKNTLFYCDPPYTFESRKGGKLYLYEFTKKDHEDFLTLAINYKGPIVISHYLDTQYQELEQQGFNRKEFETMDDGKNKRIECIWIRG